MTAVPPTGLDQVTPVSREQYLESARRSGRRVIRTPDGTCWLSGERGALYRFPAFETSPLESRFARRACLRGAAGVATYLQAADGDGPPTTTLYACRTGGYDLARLHEPVRRHVRRALRELTFSMVDRATLLADGLPAFADTRTRTGLDDGNATEFAQRFNGFFAHDGHHVLGARAGDELAAFFTLVVVDDWVEIGGFSTNAHLDLRPNNGLVHHILDHFIRERGFRLVSYGLSSLQADSNAEGLDRYKRRIGFVGEPVRRRMQFHPLLPPALHPLSLRVVQALLARSPRNRILKKAEGALRLAVASK